MITINDFMVSKNLDPYHMDAKIEMEQVMEYIREYATIVREEQIKFSAIGGSYHAATIRNMTELLDKDMESCSKVCRVKIDII